MTALRLRYQTLEFNATDIHLCTLRDRQQFHDPLGVAEEAGISSAMWPIFGVVWPSSVVLAHILEEFDTAGRRILEVGCGIALPSLLLNSQGADITATDFHPEVEVFLKRNVALNHGYKINYECTDWRNREDSLEKFDLIIGSDLLYEDQHIRPLAGFISRHAKHDCEVILVDPGRGRNGRMTAAMAAFGFSCVVQHIPCRNDSGDQFNGQILNYTR